MNLREAAQQALEAIELHLQWHESGCVYLEPAVTALRDALAEDAMQRLTDEQQMIERGTKAWADVPDATAWVQEMRGNVQAPTSQESRHVEPVAWMWDYRQLDGHIITKVIFAKHYSHSPGDLAYVLDGKNATPLYADPPKRKPLTDEDIDALRQGEQRLNFVTLREFRVIARAIERAHGIGGGE
jgi:hypothetical protein